MTEDRLVVRCLGPLELCVGGRPVTLTTGRLRTLVVMLALSAGRPVSSDRLGEAVWGEDDLPADVRASLQTYKSRLRGLLGAAAISVVPTGYALHVDPEDVDVLRFERLLDAAVRTTDPVEERALLGEALGLWRGVPFEGVRSAWLESSEAPRLRERYLLAVERYADLGGTDLQPLLELADQHPLRESLWARLLVALDQHDRTAEALERYEMIRARIADELGVDPGAKLRKAHAQLLSRTKPTPRQLPTDIRGFVGREAVLADLDRLVGVTTVTGAAGIGKTSLVVHWAHRIADRFPNGQLYVDLRGFDPSGQPMAPADAVRGFLDALRVGPEQMPSGFDAQVAKYRGLVAHRRMLVILDNAASAEQVRPLLPGGPACAVVVTSRNPLPELVVDRQIELDLLSDGEAWLLLADRAGPDRVAAEPAAVPQIIKLCSRLPLALAIVAARAAMWPGRGFAVLAEELRDRRSALDVLSLGDERTDLRAVFSWSYRTLGGEAARLFRLLGLHPGPEVSVAAAASIAGVVVNRVRDLLAELRHAHLVTEHRPGRYTLHDLLRVHAAELAHAQEPDAERGSAVRRMLDHYTRSAHHAGELIGRHRDSVELERAVAGVTLQRLTDHRQAMDWLNSERAVLVAAVELASDTGFDAHAWQLGWALLDFLERQGHWAAGIACQSAALEAARRLADPAMQALSHRALARAQALLGQHRDAHDHLRQALRLSADRGDVLGQAHAHRGLVQLLDEQGYYRAAIDHGRQALHLYRTAGHRAGQANTLNAVGWCHAQLGEYRRALVECQRALVLLRELGNPNVEAATWDSLGFAHQHLGHHRQAVVCYRRSLELCQATGDRREEVNAHTHLGDAYYEAGQPVAAQHAWRRALAILEELEHPSAEQVRSKLQLVG